MYSIFIALKSYSRQPCPLWISKHTHLVSVAILAKVVLWTVGAWSALHIMSADVDAVDWDDILPVVEAATESRVAPVPADEPASAQQPDSELSHVDKQILQLRRRRGRFLPIAFPHPRARSFDQHWAVAARMREIRALKRADAMHRLAGNMASTICEQVKALGVRVSGMALARIRRGGLVLHDKGKKKRGPIPWQCMLDVSFSGMVRRNDIAKAHKFQPASVTKMSCAVALALTSVQQNACEAMTSFAESTSRLAIFGSALAFDESKERVSLPLSTDLQPGITRSAWNCLVSAQRLSWAWHADDGSDDVSSNWSQVDVARPPVPMLATDHRYFLAGLYEAPQIRGLAECEDRCLVEAKLCFLHWDRDGAGNNSKAIATRARRAQRKKKMCW